MYCKHCGAETDVRKARCPVCGADQRKRRFSFFSLIAVLLAGAMFAGVLLCGYVLHKSEDFAALTSPAAYTAQTIPSTDETTGETVYITHAGTKYHKDGCMHLNDTKQLIALDEAIREGYEPCAVCFPEAEETS